MATIVRATLQSGPFELCCSSETKSPAQIVGRLGIVPSEPYHLLTANVQDPKGHLANQPIPSSPNIVPYRIPHYQPLKSHNIGSRSVTRHLV